MTPELTPNSPETGARDPLERLKAGLDKDEQRAEVATQGDWQCDEASDVGPDRAVVCIDHPSVPGAATVLFEADWGTLADASHIARHDPARTLREVAAYREIMELAREANDHEDSLRQEFMLPSEQENAPEYVGTRILLALAAIYDSSGGSRSTT